MLQTRIVLIGRQIYPVEARMALRQLRRIARLLDRESPRSVRALEVFESIDGYARRARRELEQP